MSRVKCTLGIRFLSMPLFIVFKQLHRILSDYDDGQNIKKRRDIFSRRDQITKFANFISTFKMINLLLLT